MCPFLPVEDRVQTVKTSRFLLFVKPSAHFLGTLTAQLCAAVTSRTLLLPFEASLFFGGVGGGLFGLAHGFYHLFLLSLTGRTETG